MNGDLYGIISLVVLAVMLLLTLGATAYGLMSAARLARRGHREAALTGSAAILIPSAAALYALPLLIVGLAVFGRGPGVERIVRDLVDHFADFSHGLSAMLCFALISIVPFALVLHLVARDPRPTEVE